MTASLPAPKHSKKEIVAAGRILAERSPPLTDEVAEAFRVAHAWRTAHALPMRRVRDDPKGKARRSGDTGLTAARITRMASIRAKLARAPLSLYRTQDLAGVRATVPDLERVERIAALYLAGETPHAARREDDHISAPKPDGYRSRHLVPKFAGTGGDEACRRQSVEMQLRARLQHVWSPAVEAVGLAQGGAFRPGRASGRVRADPGVRRRHDLSISRPASRPARALSISASQDQGEMASGGGQGVGSDEPGPSDRGGPP